MGKMIDITGQRFGKLLVIENAGKLDGRRYFWKCQCDCGNIVTIEGSRLRSGNTKSCGCGQYDGLRKHNLELQEKLYINPHLEKARQERSERAKIALGSRFGKLTVIKDIGLRPYAEGHSRRWYKCLCDCGNIKEVSGNRLKQGQTLSCGKCLKSKGEYNIAQILDTMNVIYNQEVIIPLLVKETGRRLRFDFAIYDENGNIKSLIEFDGRQHYDGPDTKYWSKTTDTLNSIKERDRIKNNFCLKYNIPLYRIPYWIVVTKENLFSDEFLIKGDDKNN